jgi:hypothetical protein
MEPILKKSKFVVMFAVAGVLGVSSQTSPINSQIPKLNALVDRSLTSNVVNLPDDCSGRSDYPHKSVHAPGRVNVVAETVCPGQMVEVKTTLTRPGWFIFTESATDTKSGFGRAKISVSMPCKWEPGQPAIGYIVMSVHSSATGGQAITRVRRFLKC